MNFFKDKEIMKKLILTCNLLVAFFAPIVEAKEILGLNFCGKVSVNDVKKSLEENGAILRSEDKDTDTGELILSAENFKIGEVTSKVQFNIFNDKLYRISLDGNVVSSILDAKYGILRKENLNGLFTGEKYYYNSKDKNIDIYISIGEVTALMGRGYPGFNNAVYLCKSIDKLISIEKERINKNKQLQKKGANQL